MNPAQTHLAQMVGLLGTFPLGFLQRCKRATKYFDNEGEPFRCITPSFLSVTCVDVGNLLQPGSYSITLQDLLTRAELPYHEIAEVSDFLLHGLTIDPAQRWTAAQLLEHPWLGDKDI